MESIRIICDGCIEELRQEEVKYLGKRKGREYHACSYKCKLQADRDTKEYSWMKPIKWVKV